MLVLTIAVSCKKKEDDPQPQPQPQGPQLEVLEGELTSEKTLDASRKYLLKGQYIVRAGGVLRRLLQNSLYRRPRMPVSSTTKR